MKRVFTKLFIVSVIITGIFSVWSLLDPQNMGTVMSKIQMFVSVMLQWFIKVLPMIIMVVCFVFAISKKYGNIKFGGPDAKTEFSTFSWLAMLFTASVGMGIIYFGVNESLYAYYLAPNGISGGFSKWEAAKNSMGIGLYHWGISAWAIFSMSGMAVGYFTFRHGTKYLPGEPILFAFKGRPWAKPVAYVMNVLGVVCSALTIATTMGLGSFQLATGARFITGVPIEETSSWPFIALGILFLISTAAAITPLSKGMKWIGNLNIWMAIIIMVFVMIVGPTRYIFEQVIDVLGTQINTLISKNFEMFIFVDNPSYTIEWDVATLLWWISWTPFMCIFIASISKGRRIKDFFFATITIPVVFMILWLSTFAGTALLNAVEGDGQIAKYALENADQTFFALLATLPLSNITQVFTFILMIFFLATTCTSCSMSLSKMTDAEGKKIDPVRTAVWSFLMTLIAITAIVAASKGGAEGLYGIRALATTMALPYLFFYLLIMAAFIKQIRKDERNKKE